MPYDDIESSNHEGRPVRLYQFTVGTKSWFYCTGDTDQTLGDDVHKAMQIADEGITLSGEPVSDDLTIKMPKTERVPQLFVGTPPSEPVYVTLRSMHIDDVEAPVIWVGTISNVKAVSDIEAEIVCRMLTSSFDRNGLRLAWSRGCPHALYDQACRVNKTDYAITAIVAAVSGSNVFAGAMAFIPAGHLEGGMVEWTTVDGFIERRAIESQTATFFRVLGVADGIEVGSYVTVYPGCDRTSATCESKFNNLLNYGGFPHIPGKSPFDGDPIY